MNQNQIQQLTSHLSQALDQNYDVVNMETVLSVICALEGTTITKEQLEATRLAKYINQLRRRTKNEHLARRAKSLLKKWREMVGIQQTVNESQSHQLSSVSLQQQQQPSSDFVKTDLDQESIHLPLSPSQQIIHPETQNSSDTVHHTSFSNLVNNVHRESKNKMRRHEAAPIANTENEPAVVIDIASDSDETDYNSSAVAPSKRGNAQNSILAIPIPVASPIPKQKKLKKAKKHKDNDVQNVRVHGKVAETLSQADSEIFSLSNSSMSSIFSAEAITTLGNSQHNKTRLNASELTFTGRFKSASSHNNNSAGLFPVRSNEPSRKQAGKYDDYNNIYDSSGASCSRLSPLNMEDSSRKIETTIDASMHQAVLVGSNDLENTTSQSRLHIPKKRGRKRGSKGVDSLITKDTSASLSQQIFFGQGSTVKKVKTTKELFNEIQSRKLSVSTTSNLSSSSTTNRAEQGSIMAAMFPRPASSCSDTSIHSPQIMETCSGNVTLMGADTFSNKLDAAITDSDTVTSEPSRDSNKSQEIKGTSLDNSNSNSFGTFGKSNMNIKQENLNDITTQLMHLIHSLKSPLSVYEIEQMYLAELVPCSCVIMEDDYTNALKGEPEIAVSDNISTSEQKFNLNMDNTTTVHRKDQDLQDIRPSIKRLDNDHEMVENQLKPVRSIFDLDFDDDNDLHSIMLETKPAVKMEEIKKKLEVLNVSQLDINYTQEVEQENSETIAANLPIIPSLVVQEDPHCLAKQRFYVQTNQVTSFHINALHNYYIPNINGNWNDLENNSMQPWDSMYTVTNGADVVPKYGLIASDRIKKDLSSLKFLKPFKAKPFKSLIAPFLGVAKCLPTCRRAKRRLNISFNRFSHNPGGNYNVPMEMPPLNVNIDGTDSGHNENAVPIKNLQISSSYDDTSSRYFISDIPKSNNLLKLVEDQVGAEEIMKEKKNDWNGKNFNNKTSDNNSSSDSDSEDKNENDYENNEEYAIVQRPTTTSRDHIVLTIKKTPSKVNSPANSLINTMTSPVITSNTSPTTFTTNIKANTEENGVQKVTVPVPLTKFQLMRLPFRPHRYRKRTLNTKTDLDLKHEFYLKETSVAVDMTMREKLFFQHELYGEPALDMKERTLNYSNSSSNSEESEGEEESSKAKNRSTITTFDKNRFNLQSETETREGKIDSDVLSSSDTDIDGGDENFIFEDAQLDLVNNSLLKSFNLIQTDSQKDYLNGSNKQYCNNNHLGISTETPPVKKLPLLNLEYRTGYRSLPENNDTSTNAAGYQEFKEWHQVLQLKSYNNEPLIVLPYVVLE
ncbi:mediator of RNA polymerase II transcription subunit 26 isoform X1 [Drosophila kikkawai]|uniref:Mediator of RNA polymerase II transcription subunit 26 n=1 Tax=Drosophila kikkawai TaxID=30033 RepID=A0A6P4J3F3_DROKI|nr:mediator of RNA polymerase II transcription subunit 26 [Drosophila kikkawai]XP_017029089.1 mediator of RNA polymerase II transcription subunit 26 [Drosophila kikkawai]XP_017029090.1 mediator of RNA polymerase II transcription subunit 26 [Drosophila kikkawai]